MQQLQEHLERTAAANAASSSHARLQAQRQGLPAAAYRGECMQQLQQHQVGSLPLQYVPVTMSQYERKRLVACGFCVLLKCFCMH
jgi:hypothetical protein